MSTEEIQNFIKKNVSLKNKYVKIEFAKRDPIYGIFITAEDYKYLSAKNFWRIVTSKHFDDFNKTNNTSLAKIFNGGEFSKLSLLSDEF